MRGVLRDGGPPPPSPRCWGGAGSGLPVLSCERQTFGRVITRRTALGVISDRRLLESVCSSQPLWATLPPPPLPQAPPDSLLFRLHLHEESRGDGAPRRQYKQLHFSVSTALNTHTHTPLNNT